MRLSLLRGVVSGLAIGLIVIFTHHLPAQTQEQFTAARTELVEKIIVRHGIKNPRVIQAIRDTQRHEFVP